MSKEKKTLNKIEDMKNQVICGHSIEVLRGMPENSVDSIVTDPPYELGFMGKKWDSTGIAYNVELWRECLRVLKPGGHLMAFSGTRTYHRMAVAIEDAGFEVRDMLEWIYASGFPKSQNIGKMYDKMMGNEREVVGSRVKKAGDITSGNFKKGGGYSDKELTETKGTSPYEGLGSALKPAHEPICMARKPLSENTIVENVVKWGTGGIDIDGCRIPTSQQDAEKSKNNWKPQGYDLKESIYEFGTEVIKTEQNQQGRFPANILCSNDALNDGVITKSPSGQVKRQPRKSNVFNGENCGFKSENLTDAGLGDSGSKSRYFDIDAWGEKNGLLQFPKASKSERGSYNNHPTVKPIHLMSYLIRLVTPKGGIVLDPFGGSGTTACSAIRCGYGYIIIEKEQNHVEIINKRISEYSDKPNQPDLFESLL